MSHDPLHDESGDQGHDSLHDALEHLVSGIAQYPDEVLVDRRDRGSQIAFEVRLNPADLGRVIGRRGRTVQALRTVMSALAEPERVRVDIIDTDNEESP